MKNIVFSLFDNSDFRVGQADDGSGIVFELNGKQFSGHDIEGETSYQNITKIGDSLYEVFYDECDYMYAEKYFKGLINNSQKPNVRPMACSSVRKGNFCGRNFDWIYSNQATLVVHMSKMGSRHESVAVTGTGVFDSDFVESGRKHELYKILPFDVVDGINDCGVYVNNNVVPLDKGVVNETTPEVEEKVSLCEKQIPRFVLDNFSTAHDAVEYLRDYVTIYKYQPLVDQHYQTHFMVADATNTYLVELIDGAVVITDMTDGSGSNLDGKPYMTNFHLSDVTLNNDGSVFTPESQTDSENAIKTNNITPHGSGLERYNLIANRYSALSTKESVQQLMYDLYYTHAYPHPDAPIPTSDPYWYSEFVGDTALGEFTVVSKPEDFAEFLVYVDYAFKNKSKDPKSPFYGAWWTEHSCVYDIENRKLYLRMHEGTEEFEFGLESDGHPQLPEVRTQC